VVDQVVDPEDMDVADGIIGEVVVQHGAIPH